MKDGLQQGAVNCLILFNIYTNDLHQMYGLNSGNKGAIAFADNSQQEKLGQKNNI